MQSMRKGESENRNLCLRREKADLQTVSVLPLLRRPVIYERMDRILTGTSAKIVFQNCRELCPPAAGKGVPGQAEGLRGSRTDRCPIISRSGGRESPRPCGTGSIRSTPMAHGAVQQPEAPSRPHCSQKKKGTRDRKAQWTGQVQTLEGVRTGPVRPVPRISRCCGRQAPFSKSRPPAPG